MMDLAMFKKLGYVCVATFALSQSAWAQKPNTTSDKMPQEHDVMLEKAFIEATRERIVGNSEAALAEYQKILQKDNDNDVVLYEVARLHDKMGQLDQALTRIERAVTLDKGNLPYNQLYVSLLEKKGEYKRAAEQFPKLIERYPDREQLYIDWAYFLAKANKPDQAIKAYLQLEERVGFRPEIVLRRHQLYLSMNKAKQAEKELLTLVEKMPSDVNSWLTLAHYYKNTGRADKAREAYREVLRLDNANPEANVELSSLLLAEGDEAGYLRSLASVFDSPTQSGEAKVKILEPLIGKALTTNDEAYRNKILDLCMKVLQAHPSQYKAHWFYAQFLQKNKQYAQAFDEYKQAIDLHKNTIDIWRGLLETAYELRRIGDIYVYSQEMLDLFPSHAIGYYYHAIALHYKGEFGKAIEMSETAQPMAASDTNLNALIFCQLGIDYAAVGKSDKSDKALDNALKVQPNNGDVWGRVAYAYALRNQKLDQALQLIQKATTNQAQNPLFETVYAAVLYRQGKFSDAKTWLEQARQHGGSEFPETLEQYGDVLYRLNDTNKAVEFWEKALNKGATSPNLQRKVSTKQIVE